MVKIKKILFFGLGSIGTRHFRLLKKNYSFNYYAYRTKKGGSIQGITNIYSLEEALEVNPDIAFITNPTSLHIKTAISCLQAGIPHLFIEKPLSDSLNDFDIFFEEVKKTGALVYVGYNMRFNPVLVKLKEIIENRKNDIFYAQTVNSSHLPNWRPGRDYRDIYSSKKSLGGGVILDLIHEFDYNEWFFGKIKSITGTYGKISPLEIDTEDFCEAILKFHNNMNAFIHLNYFGQKIRRSIHIMTFYEEIVADIINKEIIFENYKKKEKIDFKFERDDVFEKQIQYFIEGVENQDKRLDNLRDAKELIEKLFEFKKNNKMINNSYI